MMILIPFALLSGCSGSREAQLEQGFATVTAIMERAGNDYASFIAYQSAIETGGTVITYITANLPPGDSVLNGLKLETGRPSRPWTIVIRAGKGPGDYVIDGYGKALDKPLHTKSVTISPLPSP
jgi:hypothetical protein